MYNEISKGEADGTDAMVGSKLVLRSGYLGTALNPSLIKATDLVTGTLTWAYRVATSW